MVMSASPLEGVRMDPAQVRLMDDDSALSPSIGIARRAKTLPMRARRYATRLTLGRPSTSCRSPNARPMRRSPSASCGASLPGEVTRVRPAMDPQRDGDLGESFEFKARELHLPNGGRVVSLPGRNPDALAGLTGNVIFTELGLFPNGGYEHWRVVFPLTTRGHRVIVISTPRGKNTKFFELVSDPETYSVHTCDIHRSIAEGLHPPRPKR